MSERPADLDAYGAATDAFAEQAVAAFSALDAGTGSLEQRFAAVGRALDTLRDALTACSVEARQSAVEAALAPVAARLVRGAARSLLGGHAAAGGSEAERDAWTSDASRSALCAVARHWDVALATGPVQVVRYSALLYAETAHLFDSVVPDDVHAWLMERANAILEGLADAGDGDGDETTTSARAYLEHIARGELPFGLRAEHERDVPQLRVSCADMLEPRACAQVFALRTDTRRWLAGEAARRRDALMAEAAPSLAGPDVVGERKRLLKHLAAIERGGGVPPGFVAALV